MFVRKTGWIILSKRCAIYINYTSISDSHERWEEKPFANCKIVYLFILRVLK